MLGFNPFSDSPISDIGLPVITGTLFAVDEDDTCNINGNNESTGFIDATDENDTANLVGTVADVAITGTISVTDENDTANITGTVGIPIPEIGDGDGGWTKEEYKRLKRIQKKIAQAERKKFEAFKAAQEARKSAIKELVDPTPKTKEINVQSNQEVSADIPSDLTKFDATIARLVKEQEQLVQAAFYRNELARIQTQLAILEAQRVQELDDEAAILLLI
jgi:membrane-associated HD superfamily phosphohydrolase